MNKLSFTLWVALASFVVLHLYNKAPVKPASSKPAETKATSPAATKTSEAPKVEPVQPKLKTCPNCAGKGWEPHKTAQPPNINDRSAAMPLLRCHVCNGKGVVGN